MLTESGIAVLVQLIGIGSKDGIHVERITLGYLQSQSGAQVTPWSDIRCHVIRHTRTQLVNQTDFLGRVVVYPHLHLHVVGYIHSYATRLASTRHAIKTIGIGRVSDQRHIAVGIGLLIGIIVAVSAGAEVRCIAETNLRGEDMADGYNLVAEELFPGHVHTIQLGGCTDTETPVVDIIESVNGIGHLSLRTLVPVAHHLVGVHTVGEVERRIDIQVVEQGEIATDGDVVLHTITPVSRQTGVEQQVFLGSDGVAQLSRVTHGNLLVPAFLARHLLSFEGIEAADGDIQVGHGQSDGRVAHILVQVHR